MPKFSAPSNAPRNAPAPAKVAFVSPNQAHARLGGQAPASASAAAPSNAPPVHVNSAAGLAGVGVGGGVPQSNPGAQQAPYPSVAPRPDGGVLIPTSDAELQQASKGEGKGGTL